MFGPAAPLERSQRLAAQYLREGSPDEINISASQRKLLLEHIDDALHAVVTFRSGEEACG